MTFIGRYKLLVFDEIDSTSSEAIRFTKKDKPNMDYVILAKTQTKAHGRSGKNWQSSAGNLHASLLIKPNKELELLPQLSFVMGLAVYDSISTLRHSHAPLCHSRESGNLVKNLSNFDKNLYYSNSSNIFLDSHFRGNNNEKSNHATKPSKNGDIQLNSLASSFANDTVKLKWPNDVLVNDHKIAGILLESVKVEDDYYLIIGIGVNITSHPVNIDQPTTSLVNENLPPISPQAFLEILIENFEKYYQIWETEGFSVIRKIWLEHAYKLHENITVKHQDNIITSIFKGIDPSGRIILQLPSKKIISFSTADLSF